MKINITQSIRLEDYCRIKVNDSLKDEVGEIIVTFSSEAILGFATELLWLYEDIGDKKAQIETHQLGIDPSPSQAMGFYLTPSSPMLYLKINCLENEKFNRSDDIIFHEIDIKNKNSNQYFDVRSPEADNEYLYLEAYEIGRKNIVDISVFNKHGIDMTECCNVISIELNKDGLKNLATMLFIWLNNLEQPEYLLVKEGQREIGYHLGVILTCDSVSTKFRCSDLGQINQYDSRM